MAFGFLRRRSLLTHGFVGWWWATRHNYPGNDHAVRIPIYGWVDAEAAGAVTAAGTVTRAAALPAPVVGLPDATSGPAGLANDDDSAAAYHDVGQSLRNDARITTFPARA